MENQNYNNYSSQGQQYQQPYGQPQYQQPQYQQPQYQQPYGQPQYRQYGAARMLNTSRGLLKFILLNIITFGIYSLVFYSGISEDINVIARMDGKKTMHYCLMFFIIGPLTLGIGFLVWFHNISSRMGNELIRRGIMYQFGAADYWLWGILGSFILIGPFVYIHKLARASVLLAIDYNTKGN